MFDEINTNNSHLECQELGDRIRVRVINDNPEFLQWETNKYYNWGAWETSGEPYDNKSMIFLTKKDKFLNCIKLILENRCWLNNWCFEVTENSKFDNFFRRKAAEIYECIPKVTLVGQISDKIVSLPYNNILE